jgi:hypothetical protein
MMPLKACQAMPIVISPLRSVFAAEKSWDNELTFCSLSSYAQMRN